MRIGELAERTGVSERLLRYYEQQRLLNPQRSPSCYRRYDEADVATVAKIRALLGAGLTTVTIAGVLNCIDDPALLLPNCPALIDELMRERERQSAIISRSRAIQRVIDDALHVRGSAG